MSQVQISLVKQDPDVRSRLIKVRVHQKEIETPRRSFCLTSSLQSEAKLLKNPEINAVNEVPKEIDKKRLEEIDDDEDKQEAFYRELRYRFSGIDTSTILTSLIYTYNNKGKDEKNKQPSRAETDYLCTLLNHPLNDLWVPPLIPRLSGKAYLPYLTDFLEQSKSYSRVACAGLIPHVARIEIRQLAEFYAKQGLNYFVMDFAGKNPLDLVGNINAVLQMIDDIEKQSGETCFLHAINVPLTKAHWNNAVVPAKDILLFELGFNCFGSSHVRRKFPKELAKKPKPKTRKYYRLFNRKDYGYYRNDVRGLKSLLEEKKPTLISLNDFIGGGSWDYIGNLEKGFNVERHALEANEIRARLDEGSSIAKMMKDKSQIPDPFIKKILQTGSRYDFFK